VGNRDPEAVAHEVRAQQLDELDVVINQKGVRPAGRFGGSSFIHGRDDNGWAESRRRRFTRIYSVRVFLPEERQWRRMALIFDDFVCRLTAREAGR